jgi:two-component system nitrate/nitrite response regulator NarL
VVVGDAADAGEAQRRAQESLQPDVILLDNHLPGVNGRRCAAGAARGGARARILMLTVSEDERDLAAALRNGASGYLLKTIEGDACRRRSAGPSGASSVIAPR